MRMGLDLILRDGQVTLGDACVRADVGVEGEKIAVVARPGSLPGGTQTLDLDGRFVVPGGVDPHVHAATTLGEFTTRDDFEACTRAAAWGGTTTIVDFAIPQPRDGARPLATARERMAAARREAVIDVAFHACLVKGDSASLAEVPQLAREGLTTVKVFTIYRDLVMLGLDEVHACMHEVAAAGGLVLVHAESPHIVEPLRARFAAEGRTDARHHALSRPVEAEVDMVRSVLELFRLTGCPGYFVHVTAPASRAPPSGRRPAPSTSSWTTPATPPKTANSTSAARPSAPGRSPTASGRWCGRGPSRSGAPITAATTRPRSSATGATSPGRPTVSRGWSCERRCCSRRAS